MTTILLYLICFSIFAVLQALAANGVHECFKGSMTDNKPQGMIFYMMAPEFFERNRNKFWAKTYTCVRCISGWFGTLTFWSIVLPVFGFKWIEVVIWILDLFILVSLNYWIYKQL